MKESFLCEKYKKSFEALLWKTYFEENLSKFVSCENLKRVSIISICVRKLIHCLQNRIQSCKNHKIHGKMWKDSLRLLKSWLELNFYTKNAKSFSWESFSSNFFILKTRFLSFYDRHFPLKSASYLHPPSNLPFSRQISALKIALTTLFFSFKSLIHFKLAVITTIHLIDNISFHFSCALAENFFSHLFLSRRLHRQQQQEEREEKKLTTFDTWHLSKKRNRFIFFNVQIRLALKL